MNAKDFFTVQVRVLQVASNIKLLPLRAFLAAVPDAVASVEEIEDPKTREKAQALLKTSVEIAENLLRVKL